MIAIDTNLLVYAHRSSMPQHRAAREAIEEALEEAVGCGIAAPSVAEFWAVVTHSATDRPSKPEEALGFLAALGDGGVEIWPMTGDAATRMPRIARDLGVRGVRIFDLQIALTALDAGATEIWTHDRNFVTVPGLKVRDPLG